MTVVTVAREIKGFTAHKSVARIAPHDATETLVGDSAFKTLHQVANLLRMFLDGLKVFI